MFHINKRDLEFGTLSMLKNCNYDCYFHYDDITEKWFVDRNNTSYNSYGVYRVPDILKGSNTSYWLICAYINDYIIDYKMGV